jgi:hypothetical protein
MAATREIKLGSAARVAAIRSDVKVAIPQPAGHRRGDESDLDGHLTIHGSQHVHLSLDNRL